MEGAVRITKDTRAVNNRKKKQQLKKVRDVLSKHGGVNDKPKANSNAKSAEDSKKSDSQNKQSPKSAYKKSVKPQPSASWAELHADDQKENDMKDFETLIKAPVSEGSHFVFKSEQEWIDNNDELSEFFSLDLKKLSATLECIPFYELHEIEEDYFTKDQITWMRNKAEKAKEILENRLADNLPEEVNNRITEILKEKKSFDKKEEADTNIDDLEEDLDFLLSLKEPTERDKSTPLSCNSESKSSLDTKIQPKDTPKMNFEDSTELDEWLDSVLDE